MATEIEIEINRKKDAINTLIVFLIYLTVFVSSYTFFKQPFEFHFGYLVYFTFVPIFYRRYGQIKELFYLFIILLFVGLFNVMIGNNTTQQFFKVYVGLALAYYLYYYVIIEFDKNIELLFKWYLKGAYIVSVIGLVQFVSFQIGFKPGYDYTWLLNKWGIIPGGFFGIRVNSVFPEPTFLGSVVSAAFFVSLYNVIWKRKYHYSRIQSLIIILVYLLSFSGLGQTGIFLSFILLAINFGLIRYVFVFVPVAILLFNYLYNNVEEFRTRYDSTIDLFTGGKFILGKTHGSSFILYNNYVVATENFSKNPLFGTGIGSHVTAFEKYSIAKDIKQWGFNLNSADANSMFLRLMSETGLFGLGIFAVIIIKGYVKRDERYDTHHWLISNAILVMILLNMFRQGHYFLNGFPFFVLMYIYNAFSYNKLLAGEKESFEEEDTSDNSSESKELPVAP
jgi:hypothetical protein